MDRQKVSQLVLGENTVVGKANGNGMKTKLPNNHICMGHATCSNTSAPEGMLQGKIYT